jgi:hypothetical protein
MSLQERSDLILSFATVLFTNGQATDQTIGAAERLGRTLGLRARIIPRTAPVTENERLLSEAGKGLEIRGVLRNLFLLRGLRHEVHREDTGRWPDGYSGAQ